MNSGFDCRVLLQGIAKYADFKMFEEEGPNTTDVDASLQQLKDNDAKLKELNLNNIKVETCVKGVACRVSRRRHTQCMFTANAKAPVGLRMVRHHLCLMHCHAITLACFE